MDDVPPVLPEPEDGAFVGAVVSSAASAASVAVGMGIGSSPASVGAVGATVTSVGASVTSVVAVVGSAGIVAVGVCSGSVRVHIVRPQINSTTSTARTMGMIFS